MASARYATDGRVEGIATLVPSASTVKRRSGSVGVLYREREQARREERARCLRVVEEWPASAAVRAELVKIAEVVRGRPLALRGTNVVRAGGASNAPALDQEVSSR